METSMQLDPINKLTKDIKQAATKLSATEVRYLVDSYYQMQENRKRSDNQLRSLTESKEPHMVMAWLSENNRGLENQIKRALDAFSASQEIGQWARKVKGIGPVIAAGLIAHIDINKAPTVGHIWRYAGLDPTSKWGKGQKRPWNASLKTLCWKIGQSFVKVSGYDDAFYGKIYLKRKEYEQAKNEAGDYADQAAWKLENFKIGKTTDAYKSYIVGKLPPGHIQTRVTRYATKLFLAHLHEEWFQIEFGKPAPLPYPISILGHAHKI